MLDPLKIDLRQSSAYIWSKGKKKNDWLKMNFSYRAWTGMNTGHHFIRTPFTCLTDDLATNMFSGRWRKPKNSTTDTGRKHTKLHPDLRTTELRGGGATCWVTMPRAFIFKVLSVTFLRNFLHCLKFDMKSEEKPSVCGRHWSCCLLHVLWWMKGAF